MSAAEIERFNSAVKSDPVLRDQLKQHSKTLADIIAFAAERGYAFNVDDIKEYAKANADTELDETQLELVAGGKSITWG